MAAGRGTGATNDHFNGVQFALILCEKREAIKFSKIYICALKNTKFSYLHIKRMVAQTKVNINAPSK